MLSHQLLSGNDRECELVLVASGVADLEVIAVDRHDPAVRHIGKSAADGIGARVTDQSQS